jgi:hypothetical protein
VSRVIGTSEGEGSFIPDTEPLQYSKRTKSDFLGHRNMFLQVSLVELKCIFNFTQCDAISISRRVEGP